MALTSFNLSAKRGHLQLCFSDGQGCELEGREIMPMFAFASDLIAEIARRKRGRINGLRVDLGRRILHATVSGLDGPEVVHIAGADFETVVGPNSASLIRWAECKYAAV